MERIVDIALIFAGAVCIPVAAGTLALEAIDALTVACLLLAVTSALLCEWLPCPRVAGLLAYCALCVVLPVAVSFLPLVVYELARFVREPWPMRGLLGAAVLALMGAAITGGATISVLLSTAASSLLAVGLSMRTGALLAQRDLTHRTRDDLRERELAQRAGLSAESACEGDAGELGAEDARRRAFSQLTEREYEIVRLVAEGLDNHEIAAAAFASEGTVRNRISSVLQKTGYKNRTQLAVAWWRARE